MKLLDGVFDIAAVVQRGLEFYVNDFGNQIEKFAKSIEARYIQLIKGEDAIEFPKDGYHGDDIRELAKAFYDIHGDSYLEKSVEERHTDMARFGLERNIPKMKSDLERYGSWRTFRSGCQSR